MSEDRRPSAELIGKPENAMGMLYFVWAQSRSNNEPRPPVLYESGIRSATYDIQHGILPSTSSSEMLTTVKDLIDSDVPVLENLYFTFYLRNIPVSLREQLVRHRVGVVVGERQGFDQIPELGKSSFWSQTSRMVSMANFYSEDRYHTPESCALDAANESNVAHSTEQVMIFDDVMRQCEDAYRRLLKLGVPMEDARQVIPLAATQSLTWTCSLKTLIHVIGKRACWIAQYNLWGKVIADIARELREKVSPLLEGIVAPPCIEKGKFTRCPIHNVNLDRLIGVDPYPPCPLWARSMEALTGSILQTSHTQQPVWEINDLHQLTTSNKTQSDMLDTMREQFHALWGKDVIALGGSVSGDTE